MAQHGRAWVAAQGCEVAMAWDPPLRTAGGESFRSLDEMERSSNGYTRGLARSIRMTAIERDKLIARLMFPSDQPDFMATTG